jgi:xanthine dehydrogenase YagR molybdenum-binding subunit
VYNAGRIVNPITARSQMTGGIVWGIGQALLERSEIHTRIGRFLSKNLAASSFRSTPMSPDRRVVGRGVGDHSATDRARLGLRG